MQQRCTAFCETVVTFHSLHKISHVLNEQGTGYECLKSIGVNSKSYHMKEHPRLIEIVKFERDWSKVK